MATITNINQLDMDGIYSYADYLLWKFEERVELIKGKIFKMSPAPSRRHQEVSGNLFGEIHNVFKGHKCKLYAAPFDVRLPMLASSPLERTGGEDKILTVVQPDLCVVCDLNKLDEKGCIGAPDLIIEILSPSNSKKELKNKFDLYEESGVKEYWIVYPNEENLYINVLENGKYKTSRPIIDGYVTSIIFPDLKIHTSDIFR